MSISHKTCTLILAAAAALSSAGCGASGDFETAYVEGTIMFGDQPMTGGLLILTPIRPEGMDPQEMNIGKPAVGEIQQDGTFVLSTYGNGDGAVVGKHRLELELEEVDDDNPQPTEEVPYNLVIEIQPGSNDLNIDLSRGGLQGA